MNITRRGFIKGLLGVAAALGLPLPEVKAKPHDGYSLADLETGPKRVGEWELVGPDGEPMSTRHGGSSTTASISSTAEAWTTPSRPHGDWEEVCVDDSGHECTCCERGCEHCPNDIDAPCESCEHYSGCDGMFFIRERFFDERRRLAVEASNRHERHLRDGLSRG